MDHRKKAEADFHDRMRGVYEQDPSAHGHYLTNKKYYDVTATSRAFLDQWLRHNAAGKDVLDFGCGSGELSFIAAPGSKSLHGIDISADSVDLCTKRAMAKGLCNKATFSVRDCEATGFPDKSFDVLCESGVLHHLELDNAFSEMRRVLRPSGKAICHEALRHNPLIRLYRRRTPHLRTEWEVAHILGEPEIDLASRYFRSVEKRFFHLASLLAVPFRNRKAFPRVLGTLDRIDEKVLRLPGVRRHAWICVFILSDPR